MSSDYVAIQEEPWNEALEQYMRRFIQTAKNRSQQHESAGYHFTVLNTRWGLPLVLIPVVMSPISLILGHVSPQSEYINAGAFMVSGIIAGVYTFFRYGERLERHFGFAGRYGDVVTDIEEILVKGRAFRGPADVFSTKIKMIMDNLALTEPILPLFILKVPLPPDPEDLHSTASMPDTDLPTISRALYGSSDSIPSRLENHLKVYVPEVQRSSTVTSASLVSGTEDRV